ncbi:MAG: DNA repair protein RecN [Thermostichales cyanobacterium SRBZ-1_bins_19]
MLQRLRLENFILVAHLDLELGPGLTVLTGETGAGKSIVLDAIDCVLGGEAGKHLIRPGSPKAVLEATFLASQAVQGWLAAAEIEAWEGEVICSREITPKQSRCRVNGVVVSKQQMQSLRRLLLEMTVQGQTWQLQDGTTQRRWLDSFGGQELLAARQQVQLAYQRWWQCQQTYEQQQRAQQERRQRQDLIQFQAQELNQARLHDPQELDRLLRERERLSHVVDLQQHSLAILTTLDQGEGEIPSVSELLAQVEKRLLTMNECDPAVAPILEMIQSALIQVEESSRQLQDYLETLEADPQRLDKIERRIHSLKQLCRKYGPTLADVLQHAEQVNQELAALETDSGSLERLGVELAAAAQALTHHCQILSQRRQQAAQRLETALIQALQPLGMANVQFQVRLQPGSPGPEGTDQISYWLSPNPGQPLQPLAAIASGGEMSRILLALKLVFSQVDPVPTLVFDEIDTGVSGKVAQAIANTLHHVAQQRQVLVVTHQPLIAAVAQHHWRVEKVVRDGQTYVQVQVLEGSQRRQELAQLAGGDAAALALAFVDSLLAQVGQ